MVVANYSREFQRLIRLEELNRTEQFLDHESFEEIPLYSRDQRIRFLSHLSPYERSAQLLRFAYLHGTRLCERIFPIAGDDFFLMISILNWPEYSAGEQILPCFWVTDQRKAILPHLRLTEATSLQGDAVREFLSSDDPSPLVLTNAGLPTSTDSLRVYCVPKIAAKRVIVLPAGSGGSRSP